MLHDLVQFGVEEKAAEVYVALLRMGQTKIGPLCEAVDMHRQSVYNYLEDLEHAHLINKQKIGGVWHFEAADPSVLYEKIKQQQHVAQRLVPELRMMIGADQYVSDIQVYGGVDAFHQFHERMLRLSPRESRVDVIGAGGNEFLDIVRKQYFWEKYENTRIYKKISHRLLMYENQRDVDSAYTVRRYVEAKFLAFEIEQQPMATQVWPNSVAMLLFGEDPQVVHIQSKKIRDGFAAYFESMWMMAQK